MEGVAHVDQERMFELREELSLIHDGVDTSFLDDPGFGHLFHGVEFLVLLLFDLPDFAESATSDYIVEEEVVLGDG